MFPDWSRAPALRQDGIHVELPKRLVAHPRGIVLREILVRLVHGIRQRADVGHDLPDRAIRQPAAALFEVIELLRGQRVNLAVGACLSGFLTCPAVKKRIDVALEALNRSDVLALEFTQPASFAADAAEGRFEVVAELPQRGCFRPFDWLAVTRNSSTPVRFQACSDVLANSGMAVGGLSSKVLKYEARRCRIPPSLDRGEIPPPVQPSAHSRRPAACATWWHCREND